MDNNFSNFSTYYTPYIFDHRQMLYSQGIKNEQADETYQCAMRCLKNLTDLNKPENKNCKLHYGNNGVFEIDKDGWGLRKYRSLYTTLIQKIWGQPNPSLAEVIFEDDFSHLETFSAYLKSGFKSILENHVSDDQQVNMDLKYDLTNAKQSLEILKQTYSGYFWKENIVQEMIFSIEENIRWIGDLEQKAIQKKEEKLIELQLEKQKQELEELQNKIAEWKKLAATKKPFVMPRSASEELGFHSACWNLFNQSQTILEPGDIVLSGYILGDGRGDYEHMRKMAKRLHQLFPNKTIHLVVISAETHKDKLPILKEEICKTHLAYFGNSLSGSPKIGNSPFKEDIAAIIRNADLWVSGPIGICGLFDTEELKDAQSKGIAFTEYDTDTNLDSKGFGVKLKLGFGHTGVFTQKIKNSSWDKVENEKLKQILFNDASPTQKTIEDYSYSRQLFFCYQSYKTKFFKGAVKFGNKHFPDKHIDICFPARTEIKSSEKLASYFKRDIKSFKKNGITSIKWTSYENGIQKEISLQLQENGKELRIVDPGVLSPKDFAKAMQLSAPLVGCTGDHSVARAVSYGKIPFYQTHGHKRNIAMSLKKIAKNLFGDEAALAKLIEIDESARSKHAHDENLSAQAEQLGVYVRENLSLEKKLRGVFNERIHYTTDPNFAAFEDSLKQKYMARDIELDQVREAIQNKLREKGIIS